MAKPPTIRRLAALAGVSKATVSLALRDNPRIRESERVRIQRLAADSGYAPNAVMARLLAQLRAGKTSSYQSTLGLVYAPCAPGWKPRVGTSRGTSGSSIWTAWPISRTGPARARTTRASGTRRSTW